MKSKFIRIISGALLSIVFFTPVHAQDVGTSGGDFSGLPVDLLPPGARSLGLAGAFTAVADDATAAVALESRVYLWLEDLNLVKDNLT